MSIAIVTPQAATPATPPAASAPDAGNSDTAAFSSVLTTQQVAAALAPPAAARLGSGGKETSEALPGLGDQNAGDELLGAADAGAILAALGLIPLQTPTTPVPVDAGSGDATADPLAGMLAVAGNTSNASNDMPRLAQQTDGADTNRAVGLTADADSTGPSMGTMTPADDAAAKFAVADSERALEKSRPTASSGEDSTTFAAQIQSAHSPSNGRVEHSDSSLAMRSHLRETSWQGEFTQKLTWMANNDKQSAQITLNPPQLGPIEVSLKIDNGNAAASFVSANQEVREAIESAMPRLREMLASAGIDLGQTNVSAQSFAQQQAQYEAKARSMVPSLDDNDILAGGAIGALTGQTVMTRHGNGMVDLFA